MASTDYERVPSLAEGSSPVAEKLRKLWESKPGILGVLSTVDHKELGKYYIVTSFALLIIGGIEALVIRVQLARPNLSVLSPEQYDQLYTMHGITMILLYAMQVLTGFSVFLWPLLFGARDMAFPRLNAFTFWVFLFASIFMYVGLAMGQGANDHWFNYPPQSSLKYNPGLNIDFYALGMIFLGVSTTLGAANFMVTFLRCRAPGMSINRVPIIIWGTLTASAANLVVIPCVSLAFFLLWLDRRIGTRFYDATSGGQPLLWQHLFWIFGHPWVYAIVLPAMGMVSDGLPVFCRRPLVGYTPVALSTVGTMLLGFGVWLHHMFATGLPQMGLAFFSSVSVLITIPSAVAVFAWIATIWTGRPVFKTAFLFFAGFIIVFVIGGVSGFMTASVPADWQLTDTYFVVAHIHYVLIGINVFPVCGALYLWFPKMTGRMLDERLGKWNFWLMFIGFNLGFFPMHITGLLGMPRGAYTYPDGMGWNTLNMITSVGAFILAVGILLLIVNVVVSRKKGALAGRNPWDAPTLEWATSSPPPPYNFALVPTVASRHPLWEDRLQETQARTVLDRGMPLDQGKEAIGTSILDAEPDSIIKMPGDSFAPVLTALAMSAFFAGMLVKLWWLVGLSGVGMLVCVLAWLWPERKLGQTREPANG